MPIIYIDEGEDWLDTYRKSKKKPWYKRVRISSWIFLGSLLTLIGYAIYYALSNVSLPAFNSFTMTMGG